MWTTIRFMHRKQESLRDSRPKTSVNSKRNLRQPMMLRHQSVEVNHLHTILGHDFSDEVWLVDDESSA